MADNNSQENGTETAFVSFIDKETGDVLAQDRLTGQAGTAINYQPQARLDELAKKGYALGYNGFPQDARYSSNDNNQVFAIVLVHERMTLDPNQAGQTGTPINADDPDGAKWPDLSDYQRTYQRTIAFVDGQGNQLQSSVEQVSHWSRKFILDKVNGQTKASDQDWQADIQTYQDVDVPIVGGYVADQAKVASQAVEQQDINMKVTYQPNGHVQPVQEDGQTPIYGANPVSYQNDIDDPTKVLADQKVPEVKDYQPTQTTVHPTSPTADTKVIYKSTLQSAEISFVDADSGNELDKVTQHGKVGTMIMYNPLDELEKLNQQGYQMVKNGFTTGTTYQAGPAQKFVIQVSKGGSSTGTTQTTTPTKGQTYSMTVHFVDPDGKTLHDDNIQQVQWTPNNDGQLVPSQSDYQDVKVPVINGYCTNRTVIYGHPVEQFDNSYTVTYRPMGHFVPVDEQGQQIPNVAHPVYRNDPNDPTKLAGRQAIPQISGYKLKQSQANPSDLSQDTTIVYHRVN